MPKKQVGKSERLLKLTINELNTMSAKDLRKVVSTLSSTANKRVGRLVAENVPSLAILSVEDEGRFSSKDKNLQQLRAEYGRVKRFLNDQTSTVTGARVWVARSIQGFKERHGITITVDQFEKIMRTYNKVRKVDKAYEARAFRYALIDSIKELVEKDKEHRNVDELVESMLKNLDTVYESYAKEQVESEKSGVSSFFS